MNKSINETKTRNGEKNDFLNYYCTVQEKHQLIFVGWIYKVFKVSQRLIIQNSITLYMNIVPSLK